MHIRRLVMVAIIFVLGMLVLGVPVADAKQYLSVEFPS